MTDRKQCFKCRRSLPLGDFYRHREMADGHLNKCKECTKVDVQQNYRRRLDQYKQYDRSRNGSTDRKAFKLEEQRKLRSMYPEKYRARAMVGRAIRAGTLVRGRCEECGSEVVQAHHDDYSKPLKVRWFCVGCHHKIHREIKHVEGF